LREESREVKLIPWLDTLAADVRFGIRLLRKNPLITASAVLSLSLAIGACTAVFSLVDALVLRPLPVKDGDRLYYLTFSAGQSATPESAFSYPLFRRMREAARPYADVFSMDYQAPRLVTIDPGEGRERLRVQWLSGDSFAILGIQPSLGRLLTASDDVIPGAHPVAVLSYAFWARRFGKDPSVLGRRIRVQETEVAIIGVAEQRFTGTEVGISTDIWLPNMMTTNRGAFENNQLIWFRIWVRAKPGVDPARAREVLQAVFTNDRRDQALRFRSDEAPEKIARFLKASLNMEPAATGPSGLRQQFGRPLWILAGLVCLVLLIACANVANLLLARARAREREMALRLSIGASRARLIRQLTIESSLFAGLSAVLGVGVAAFGAPFVATQLAPSNRVVWLDLGVDLKVLGFLVAVTVLATILFGLLPSFRASAANPNTTMGGGNRIVRLGVHRVLIGAQVGFCCLVLFVSSLFVLSFDRLAASDTGFQAGDLVIADVSAPELRNRREIVPALWRQLMHRLQTAPGITSASGSGWGLLGGALSTRDVKMNGVSSKGDRSYILPVTAGFFQTMGIGIVAGREFDWRETNTDQPGIAVVNEAFAKLFFEGQNPVGRTFGSYANQDRLDRFNIIGLARDAKYRDMRDRAPPTMYVPWRGGDYGTIELRTTLDPPAAAAILNRELAQVHRAFRLDQITTQQTLVDNHMVRERLLARLSAFFALLATLLAAVGLYGVLNYAVVQRTREIGLRMALGASRTSVVRIVTTDIGVTMAIGITIGLTAGFGLQRFIQSLLFDVKASDPLALLLPAGLLLAAAMIAALPPVLRATAVNPVIALRYE
jgi:predicted permease